MTDDTTTADPRREYQLRLQDRTGVVQRYATRDGRMSTARGVVFLAGVAVALVASGTAVSAWCVTLPAALFVLLVVLHGRVIVRLQQAQKAAGYYETALARLDDDWSGTGPDGERYADPDHPYSGDLDIFGRGSLFQLVCRARTRLGEDTLAEWLMAAADPDTIRVRQQSVEELRGRVGLRENLALLDAAVREELDQTHLLHWSHEPPMPVGRLRRFASVVLAAAAIAALIGWLFFEPVPLTPLLAVLIVQIPFAYTFARQIRHVARRVDEVGSGLEILAQVLTVFEGERFTSAHLQEVRARLDTEGLPPSARIDQLSTLIRRLNNCLRNQFFAPIAFLLGLPVHVVHRIEVWRTHFGPHIPDWLSAIGELEALSALAGYAYEQADDPFAEIVDAGGDSVVRFEADELGHPLLPRKQCVRNDIRLADDLRLILVSGSNMSGKSTLLRTVGTNAVLAFTGAPIRAKRLRLSPVTLGTAMRINDSLLEGKSQFYAALSRLKSIVDLARGERPLLFLFDEILQGTNSHDRRIGTEAVLAGLINAGGLGLVTTHDLALTEIVDSLGPRAMNIHFEDRIDDGRMTFDYRIRPGVVEKSNALDLMRMMGLELNTEPARE